MFADFARTKSGNKLLGVYWQKITATDSFTFVALLLLLARLMSGYTVCEGWT